MKDKSKIDPVCGMPGTIKKHGHYFCSQECIKKYEKRILKEPWQRKLALVFIIAVLIALIAFLQINDYMILFMGIFFVAVSLLKFADWKGFAMAFSMYDIIAKRSKSYAYVYPVIELGIGISFLLSWQIIFVASITFIIMVIGTVGVAKNLMSKNPVKCACLGTKIKIPLTKFTLFEDVTMAIMALMILFL